MPISWTRVKATVIAGTGFFTDAYDLFIVNLILPMIGFAYFHEHENRVPSHLDSLVKGSAAFGTLIGQLLFGYLADKLGRKRIYGTELILILIATWGSLLAADTVHGYISVLTMLCFWRFILGIGIGGDYPLSAVITSEFSATDRQKRGTMIAAVFAMQGVGMMTAAIVSAIVLRAFKSVIDQDPRNVDLCWRLCLLIGALPALCILYYRLTIKETPQFAKEMVKNSNQAIETEDTRVRQHLKSLDGQDEEIEMTSMPADSSSQHAALIQQQPQSQIVPTASSESFKTHFSRWENLKVLLGTSISWFALDVAFYGINLNQSIVLDAIGYAPSNRGAYETLHALSIGNLIICLMGTVPAYWVSVYFIDKIGRLPIQYGGFIVLSILFFILSLAYSTILQYSITLFLILYTIAQFFFNFGPNVTTFVLAGEVFPTRFRSTCHGISAASGKFGAILAIYAFGPLKDIGGHNAFMPGLLFIFACFMLLGLVVTAWIPETKGKSLDEINCVETYNRVETERAHTRQSGDD